MAICVRCSGHGYVLASNAAHGGLERAECSACAGTGIAPPVPAAVPVSPPVSPKPFVPPKTEQEVHDACRGVEPVATLAKDVPTGEQMAEANTRAARGTGFKHPMLQAALYEKCPVCKGTRTTAHAAMVDGMPKRDGGTYSGPLPVGSPCPCCDDGYVEVGLTVAQVERFRAEVESLVACVIGCRSNATAANEPVAGNPTAEALAAVGRLCDGALSRVSQSTVASVRAELERRARDRRRKPRPT